MASTYVNNLRLNEMGTGDQSGTWGTVTNTNLELIGEALGYGTEAIVTNADTHLSTVADGSTDAARAMYVKYTGTLDSTCTVTIAPNTMKRVQIIENATSGSQSIIVKQGSGATITVPNGTTKICVLDGAGSGAAVIDALENLSITGDLTIGGDDLKMATNTSGHILVGDGTSYNPVAVSGDVTIASSGAITIANDAVEQAMIADDAVGADQLASDAVVNASIASGAAIAFSKMADLTASRALVSDSNGDVSASAVTSTELGYLDGVTSAIQTQLTNAYSSTDTNLTLQNVNEVRRGASATGIKNETDHIEFYVSSTERATLDSSGNFTADGNLGAYSDVALKQDIYQIENALEKVNNLRGVHFTRKANNSKEIGVVANEVEKVVPELVDEHLDKELGSIKIMKYANTVGLLIEAVKDLSKQVEELKK